MNEIELSPAFLIGHKVIDDEHRELVKVLNNMARGYVLKDIDFCRQNWHLFCNLLQQHFTHEEKIMSDMGYVKEEHHDSHQSILTNTQDAGRQCKTLEDWGKCLLELRDEILSQILRHDLKFSEYLITIGVNQARP
ncbi:hypothetical protein MNBD_ALPHA02-2526 [hydrothermal vent metagenome]|uniref:Hemerythrin-like domain-containing protein n=1 Tax=hydrothermal vent metagenome TaxID=652676 RepID=A0A3B0S8J7_9ZZZZ